MVRSEGIWIFWVIDVVHAFELFSLYKCIEFCEFFISLYERGILINILHISL